MPLPFLNHFKIHKIVGGVPYPFADGLLHPGILGAAGVPHNLLNGLRPQLPSIERPNQPTGSTGSPQSGKP